MGVVKEIVVKEIVVKEIDVKEIVVKEIDVKEIVVKEMATNTKGGLKREAKREAILLHNLLHKCQ